MKKYIFNMIVAFLTIASSATAQVLTALPLEEEAGTQAELVVNANAITGMTALQFNLELPDGVTFADNNATLGEANKGHQIIIEMLDNGDRLFILYSMNLDTFKDGELLRIPVNMNSEAAEGIARLHKIRFADANSVSYAAAETESIVTGISSPQMVNGKSSNDECFDLSGRRVAHPTKGIYIFNGRKVVK